MNSASSMKTSSKMSSKMSSMISSSLGRRALGGWICAFLFPERYLSCVCNPIQSLVFLRSPIRPGQYHQKATQTMMKVHSSTHDQANRVIGFVMSLMSKFVQKNSQASLNLSADVWFVAEKNMLRV